MRRWEGVFGTVIRVNGPGLGKVSRYLQLRVTRVYPDEPPEHLNHDGGLGGVSGQVRVQSGWVVPQPEEGPSIDRPSRALAGHPLPMRTRSLRAWPHPRKLPAGRLRRLRRVEGFSRPFLSHSCLASIWYTLRRPSSSGAPRSYSYCRDTHGETSMSIQPVGVAPIPSGSAWSPHRGVNPTRRSSVAHGDSLTRLLPAAPLDSVVRARRTPSEMTGSGGQSSRGTLALGFL